MSLTKALGNISALTSAAKTTTYNLTKADSLLLGNSAGGAFTFNLLAAANCAGVLLTFVKTSSDTNAITIDASGSETINGQLTIILKLQYDAFTLFCDGTQWLIVDQRIATSLLTATSGTKTPAASAHFHALSNNAVTLLAGCTYEVTGTAIITQSGGSAVFTLAAMGVFLSNGADNGTPPTLLATGGNVTVHSNFENDAGLMSEINLGSGNIVSCLLNTPPVIVSVTADTTIYGVTLSAQTTSANARVATTLNARRVPKFGL